MRMEINSAPRVGGGAFDDIFSGRPKMAGLLLNLCHVGEALF